MKAAMWVWTPLCLAFGLGGVTGPSLAQTKGVSGGVAPVLSTAREVPPDPVSDILSEEPIKPGAGKPVATPSAPARSAAVTVPVQARAQAAAKAPVTVPTKAIEPVVARPPEGRRANPVRAVGQGAVVVARRAVVDRQPAVSRTPTDAKVARKVPIQGEKGAGKVMGKEAVSRQAKQPVNKAAPKAVPKAAPKVATKPAIKPLPKVSAKVSPKAPERTSRKAQGPAPTRAEAPRHRTATR
jgi:hypothetical protein